MSNYILSRDSSKDTIGGSSEFDTVLYTLSATPSVGDDIYDQYGNKINKKIGQLFGNGISFKIAIDEKQVDIDNFSYTTSGDKVILTKYTGTGVASVAVPMLEDK